MYQIRKGWPCEGAIDLALKADAALLASGAIHEGMIVNIVDGQAAPGTNAAGVKGFVIGVDKQDNKVTALVSDLIVECDASVCASPAPAANDFVTVADGRFAPGSVSSALGRVISVRPGPSGDVCRIFWDNSVL